VASVHTYYTLQSKQKLLLVLKNIAADGEAVSIPANCPYGFVTRASREEVLGMYQMGNAAHSFQKTNSFEMKEEKKRKIKGEDIGEGEYIEENDSNQTSMKKMRLGGEEGIEKRASGAEEVGTVTRAGTASSVQTIHKISPTRKMTRRQKKRERKKTRILAMKIKYGLFRNRPFIQSGEGVQGSMDATAASLPAAASMLAASASHPATSSKSSATLKPSAVASLPVAVPKPALVALANNERLVIDTNASIVTSADANRMISNSSSGGVILCLEVEVVSDGTYSQFSQIGAVLYTEGHASYFEAKVG
jgi:hypothetical protein